MVDELRHCTYAVNKTPLCYIIAQGLSSFLMWAHAVQKIVIKDLVYEAKAKAKTFKRCPRGSSRPRPGLEDNKTEN